MTAKTAPVTEVPSAKRVKVDEESPVPESPDNEWPEAWIMPDGNCADQKALNKCSPNIPATVQDLRELGIAY